MNLRTKDISQGRNAEITYQAMLIGRKPKVIGAQGWEGASHQCSLDLDGERKPGQR